MNSSTQAEKIEKVLSKISGKEMKEFARLYACAHSDFALALIEKYWKPERGNYEEIVDACFAHTNEDCALFGDPKLDWRKIEKDLVAVMKKAMAMRRKGNVIDAALISGYVLTATCREFNKDHRNYEPLDYNIWNRRNKVLQEIVNCAEEMVKDLLIYSDEIEEDSRIGLLGDIVKECEEIGDGYLNRLTWFVDEAMPVLCYNNEKAYMAHINKRLKNKKDKYFHYRYIIQKADYLVAHGKRDKAEKLMIENMSDENVTEHHIDCFIEWKEYKEAVALIDDYNNSSGRVLRMWEDKLIEILKLSGNREWLITECRSRFITDKHKVKYYNALKEAIDAAEWNTFLTKLLNETDWEVDYDEADIKIAIAEKRFDRIKPAIERRAYRAGELYKSYVKYIPKQDLAFVGELINDNIKRLALLYEKPKQYAYLRDEINGLMGMSSTVDKVIKEGIRRLIKEYPNKHYIGNYLRQLL